MEDENKMYDLIIKNALIVDGTGNKPYLADIAVIDEMIARIGKFDGQAERIIDATGKIAAPGFIDMHSHSDMTLPPWPDAESSLGQGITTLFTGHCGLSPMPAGRFYGYSNFEDAAMAKVIPTPIGGPNPGSPQLIQTSLLRPHYKEAYRTDLDWSDVDSYYHHLQKSGIAPNMRSIVGHGQIRFQVLGIDNRRPSTETELGQILDEITLAMKTGAAGISFGLDYDPGWFASREELVAVARRVAELGGILTTHYQLRSKRRGITTDHSPVTGMLEVLDIAEEAGVHLHLSHLSGGYTVHPADPAMERFSAQRMLDIIDEYRSRGVHVTYDTICYYSGGDFFYPFLANRFLPYVKLAGGMKAFSEKLKIGNYKWMISEEIKAGKHPSGSVMTCFNNNPNWGDDMPIIACKDDFYLGKTIGQLVKETGKHYVDILLDILELDSYACYYQWGNRTVGEDAKVFMCRDDMCISLDVASRNYDFQPSDPALDLPINYGSTGLYCGFIKFLEMKKDDPVEKTIRKLTGNGADAMGLQGERGYLKEGLAADIVVFDYEALKSNENFLEPRQAPSGIDYVLVNGKMAVDKGVHTHIRSGKVLRK
jgi:N-acyl-D-amino-acid deacylase